MSAAAAGWATTTREPRTRTRTRTPRLAREASLLQLLSTLHLAPVRRARAFPTQVCVDTAPAAAPAACAGEPLPAAPHCGLQALQTTKKSQSPSSEPEQRGAARARHGLRTRPPGGDPRAADGNDEEDVDGDGRGSHTTSHAHTRDLCPRSQRLPTCIPPDACSSPSHANRSTVRI